MEYRTLVDETSRELMAPDSKIGVLSTMGEDGYPHLTFISSLEAYGEDKMSFGKFCIGLSKSNLEARPEAGFLVLNADMRWVSGNASYTHTEDAGELFDKFNSKPLFRYNTYFGFDHIYVMDLVRISEIRKLSMPKIVAGAVLSKMVSGSLTSNEKRPRNSIALQQNEEKDKLRHFGHELLSKIDSLSFVSWANEDGLLEVLPIIQAQPAGRDRIVFSSVPYPKEISAIPDGAKAAILCVSMNMQSIEAEGIIKRKGSIHYLEIDKVYNSMPPKMEYIYPRAEAAESVLNF